MKKAKNMLQNYRNLFAKKFTKISDGIIILVLLLIVGGIIYSLGDAFFGLVGDIYRFLDRFIWAFFAGIIAFFVAVSITGLIIWISIISIAFIFGLLIAGVTIIFGGRS